MGVTMDVFLVSLAIFLASGVAALALRSRPKKDEVGAQFVITATMLLVFYVICFCSGVCTILNFLLRWVF